MIYKYEDFTESLAKLHPEIETDSLELIMRKGLQGINRLMRSGQELLIHNFFNGDKQDDWIKFFINMTPEAQKDHALKNYYRKQRKKEVDGRK